MLDRYSKIIFSIIALALVALVIQNQMPKWPCSSKNFRVSESAGTCFVYLEGGIKLYGSDGNALKISLQND